EHARIVLAVTHPFPIELLAGLDHLGIALAYVGIERHRALDAVPLHHVHEAPYAGAVAVIAPGIIEHVGHEVHGRGGHRGRRPVEQKMLDVGNDPDRDACAVRQAPRFSVDDRGKIETRVLTHDCCPSSDETTSYIDCTWLM